MELNYSLVFITALIPLVISFVWYNPKVFGNAWMKSAGLTEESLQGGNMLVIFGLTYLLGIFASAALLGATIHQSNLVSLFVNQPGFGEVGSELNNWIVDFNSKYGALHRTFPHGALHGGLVAIMLVLPVVAINAMFERKGFKYIMINVGFWFICMMLIGGVLCAYA